MNSWHDRRILDLFGIYLPILPRQWPAEETLRKLSSVVA
jgi:hypothetical protein